MEKIEFASIYLSQNGVQNQIVEQVDLHDFGLEVLKEMCSTVIRVNNPKPTTVLPFDGMAFAELSDEPKKAVFCYALNGHGVYIYEVERNGITFYEADFANTAFGDTDREAVEAWVLVNLYTEYFEESQWDLIHHANGDKEYITDAGKTLWTTRHISSRPLAEVIAEYRAQAKS